MRLSVWIVLFLGLIHAGIGMFVCLFGFCLFVCLFVRHAELDRAAREKQLLLDAAKQVRFKRPVCKEICLKYRSIL